ncbi:MAG: HIT family protein [Promethearchaeota archaeon]
MSDKNCIFCKIIDKEIPAKIVFENDKIVAFLDIFPISKGHTIVVPKKHFQNLEEIPENDLCELIKIVKRLAIEIRRKLNIEGYNLLQNNFKAAGQVINHIHFHIIPRNKNDEKFKLKIPRNQATEEELNSIMQQLKN